MGVWLGVGEGSELERACERAGARGERVERVAGAAEAAARLAAPPTPTLILVAAADAATARERVAAVRGPVRGQAATVVALVPGLAAAEAALAEGAALALPAPYSDEVLAATLSAAAHLAAHAGAATAEQAPDPGLEVLFERNPNPMWFFDVDTLRFLAVNDAAVRKYGFSRDEFLAMTLRDIRPPEELPRLLEATAHTSPVPGRTLGWRHRAKDGRIFQVEIISSPVVYRGRPCELVLPHDVTEREELLRREGELRAQLAAQDRMATLGTLAAAVAHEVNNPLTWVLANVAWLEARAAAARGGDQAEQDAVREIGTGLRRIHALVRDLRSLSLGDEADVGPCDVARAVRGAVSIAAGEIRLRAALTLDLPEGLPPAAAGEARLGQVILNLLTNAAQAIAAGDVARNLIRIAARQEGGRLVIEVADSGSGIAPETLPRIFDPFFTTKRAGEGTGLGLWIVRRILGPIGGTVEALPRAPRGTIMRVTVPVASAAARAPEAAEPARAAAPPPNPDLRVPAAAARPRLLVVDDEPLVGRAVQRLLRDSAEIEVESSGRAAVARLAAGERFDVLLCDVMMPELPGPELHAEIARIDPGAAEAMVFMTGGAYTPREQAFLASVPNRCLEKPLDLAALRALLRGRAS
jgi:PAS domain S-box-containing protein